MEDIINKKENNLKNKSWPREEISTTIKMSVSSSESDKRWYIVVQNKYIII